MLTPIIHKHLDALDEIDAKAKAEIDTILATLNVKALISNSHDELGRVVEQIYNLIVDKYQPLAHLDGVKLAAQVDSHIVKIDPSNDPTKNEAVAQ